MQTSTCTIYMQTSITITPAPALSVPLACNVMCHYRYPNMQASTCTIYMQTSIAITPAPALSVPLACNVMCHYFRVGENRSHL